MRLSTTVSTIAPVLVPLVFTLVGSSLPTGTATADLEESYDPATATAAANSSQSATQRTNDNEIGPLVSAFGVASWYSSAVDEIEKFASLRLGWKGHGSVPPTREAMDQAADVLAQIGSEIPKLPRPSLSPDEDGAVVIHWRVPGLLASLAVYGDGTYSCFAEGGGRVCRKNAEPVGQPLSSALVAVLSNGVSSDRI